MQYFGRALTLALLFPDRPAVPCKFFGFVRAVEEAALKQLHGHNSEDEHEEHVDDQYVQHILQGVHHTVKNCLHGKKTGRKSCDVRFVIIRGKNSFYSVVTEHRQKIKLKKRKKKEIQN